MELESLFERHMPNEVLLDELARLREENTRLRQLK
jgi:hypothetical protein